MLFKLIPAISKFILSEGTSDTAPSNLISWSSFFAIILSRWIEVESTRTWASLSICHNPTLENISDG